jgi:hypothetical protein
VSTRGRLLRRLVRLKAGIREKCTANLPKYMSKHVISIPEQLLSRRAVADRWQTSVETVKRRERAGLLTPIRFNQRLLRYKLSDIEALEAAAGGSK